MSDTTHSKPAALIAFLGYWLLAMALSWTALHFVTSHNANGVVALLGDPALLIAKFGPSIAGLIFVIAGGGAARRSFLASLRALRPAWLLVAVLLPGFLTAMGLAGAAFANGQNVFAIVTGFSLPAAAAWIGLRIALGGGLGEEIGIRGVALPLLLQCTGPRMAALAIGLFWAAWHLPVLWGKPPLVWIGQTALTTSVSVILTFFWVRVGPSIPVAVAFHGALNGWAAYASADWVPALAHADLWQVLRLVLLLLFAIALLPLRWQQPTPSKGTATDVE